MGGLPAAAAVVVLVVAAVNKSIGDQFLVFDNIGITKNFGKITRI